MTQQLNACAYIRVSTDKQEELSPDAQKRLIIEYARKNNYVLKDEYIFTENGISGRHADKRPAFQRMIALAKSNSHPFDIILVWKYSRFARNQEESIVYKSLLKNNNVDVISISEPLVDGPFGSLIERIIEWMDEYYSIRLSGEVLRGMTENALRGGYQSGLPLGYRMNQTTGIPEIFEPEASIVRTIFSQYEAGYSLTEICRYINSLGFRTKRGKLFSTKTVSYILSNPFYHGKVRWNMQNHSTHSVKPESEWIIADGLHDKLFSDEYYEHIQMLVNTRKKAYKSHSVGTMRSWLSGIVKCSCCGASLASNNNSSSFQCCGYNRGYCNESHYIKSTELEHAIYSCFTIIIEKCEPITFTLKDYTHNKSADTDMVDIKLKRMDMKLDKLKEAFYAGIDTIDEYKKNKAKLLTEIDTLKTRRDELSHSVDNISDCDKSGDKSTDNATYTSHQSYTITDILADETLDIRIRAHALRSVVDHCVYDKKNDVLKVYIFIPF